MVSDTDDWNMWYPDPTWQVQDITLWMDSRGKEVDAGEENDVGATSVGEIDTSTILRGLSWQVREEISKELGARNEKMLAVLSCTKAQKVLFATFKLIGEAERWWQGVKLLEEQRVVPTDMTWSRFKELFYDQYFSTTTRATKAEEFFHLTQGQLIMQQYAAKFKWLFHFAPFMVPNEFQKVRWFEKGLKLRIHEQVVVLKVQSFSELVDRSTVAELSLWRSAEMVEQRKRPKPLSFSDDAKQGTWKRNKYVGGERFDRGDRGRQSDSSPPYCVHCKLRHWEECLARNIKCYQCGRYSHMARDCRELPNNAPAPDQHQRNKPLPRGGSTHVYTMVPADKDIARGAGAGMILY
ncbi:uncharacterized protein LOC131147404 [Malania oleifera]|uniref:uncharacterized protein LOC131147404 n=1 Tax=Malania oleifera TaxID=397392 RepID=UPI0025ADBE0E|nr:uncharacterized protein LOC131147404 [Malania oleifera]